MITFVLNEPGTKKIYIFGDVHVGWCYWCRKWNFQAGFKFYPTLSLMHMEKTWIHLIFPSMLNSKVHQALFAWEEAILRVQL